MQRGLVGEDFVLQRRRQNAPLHQPGLDEFAQIGRHLGQPGGAFRRRRAEHRHQPPVQFRGAQPQLPLVRVERLILGQLGGDAFAGCGRAGGQGFLRASGGSASSCRKKSTGDDKAGNVC